MLDLQKLQEFCCFCKKKEIEKNVDEKEKEEINDDVKNKLY